MIDFVPVYDYVYYFDVTILCMVTLAFWQCNRGVILKDDVVYLNAMWGFVFTALLVFYMGLRPIHYVFGDTINYADDFYVLQHNLVDYNFTFEGEWLFNWLQYWFSQHSDIHSFFLLCAFIYIVPLWIAMYRIFKKYYYLPYLVLLSMFTFWSYGVNGIRNGMAASLIILALTFVNHKVIMLIIGLIAVSIHKSLWLIICSAVVAWYFKQTAYYVLGWLGAIGVSAVFGARLSSYLVASGIISDNRFISYVTASSSSNLSYMFSSVGFRWDFLAYSSIPVIIGYYFIFKRNFKDEYYQWIYNIYLMANAFWIIVIRAEFSNRFAQISWFIMPIVLIYPFLKKRFWIHHEKILGLVLLLFYSYTFLTVFVK